MFKYCTLFLNLILILIVLNACKESEEKNLESIAITPTGQQTCNYYDTSSDSDYVSGAECDNDDLNYIQYTLTGIYSNDEEEDITTSSLVTWTVELVGGGSASILSDNAKGRAYLNTTGTFNIDATYKESATSENEDDINETASVVLLVQ